LAIIATPRLDDEQCQRREEAGKGHRDRCPPGDVGGWAEGHREELSSGLQGGTDAGTRRGPRGPRVTKEDKPVRTSAIATEAERTSAVVRSDCPRQDRNAACPSHVARAGTSTSPLAPHSGRATRQPPAIAAGPSASSVPRVTMIKRRTPAKR